MRFRKANIQEIAYTMIFIFAAAVIFLTVKYTYGDFVDRATNLTVINQSQATVDSFNTTKDLTNRFDYILFLLLIGFSLAIIIGGWFAGGHPMLSFAYFVALVLMVAFAGIFSFVWVRISTTGVLQSTTNSMPIINLILTNFPTYIAILGFIGMLVMFAKPSFTQ